MLHNLLSMKTDAHGAKSFHDGFDLFSHSTTVGREEWKQYQQQIDEPATTYQDRLRGTFSFQRTNASPGSDSQHNQHPASVSSRGGIMHTFSPPD